MSASYLTKLCTPVATETAPNDAVLALENKEAVDADPRNVVVDADSYSPPLPYTRLPMGADSSNVKAAVEAVSLLVTWSKPAANRTNPGGPKAAMACNRACSRATSSAAAISFGNIKSEGGGPLTSSCCTGGLYTSGNIAGWVPPRKAGDASIVSWIN